MTVGGYGSGKTLWVRLPEVAYALAILLFIFGGITGTPLVILSAFGVSAVGLVIEVRLDQHT